MDWTGSNDIVTGESVTIYDGRKDGKEGTPSGEATNEKTLGLNPALVQSDGWTSSAKGVTKDLQNLFRKWDPTAGTEGAYVAADKPIYVIPTGDNVRVTITYDIETADDKLSTYVSDVTTHGSSIENVISKDINFGSSDLTALENGKSYVINLHLGMNSVKFDADVTDWVEAETTPDVDVPANVPQFEAKASGSDVYTVELPATTELYTFAITGLNGGEAIDAPDDVAPFTNATAKAANSSGVAIESVKINRNMTPKDKTAVPMTWTGKSSRKEARMSFVQKAHALELKIKSVEDNIITLDAGATGINWSADIAVATLTNGDNDAIKVWRNGSRLLFTDNASNDGEFTYAGTPDKIRLKSNLVPGETYTIYVKAGDAEGETVTFHVGGPALSSEKQVIEYGETYQRKPIFYGADGVTPDYTWKTSSGSYINVNDDGVVTAVGKTSEDQDVTLETATITNANGWVYDTSDRKYKVEVKAAEATISFTTPEPAAITNQAKNKNAVIIDNPAILKNKNGDILKQGDTDAGSIVYSIESVTGQSDNTNLFQVPGGTLKVGSSSTLPAGNYTVKVKAQVYEPSNGNATYAQQVIFYTVNITVNP
jgi:hypothetical protein